MFFDLPLDQLQVYRPARQEPADFDALYNYYAGPKAIKVWEFNQHDGGETYQLIEKMKFLRELWG